MIDFNFENNVPLQKGSLLISEPFLADQYFGRSVIFICEHNEEGTFGFVLNNFVAVQLENVVTDFPDIKTKVSIGGPVDTSNLFFLHGLGDLIPDSREIIPGVYIGGRFETVKEALRNDPSRIEFIRFFIGYSGWDADQLKAEMKEKSWLVKNKFKSSRIFDINEEDIWKHLLEDLGGKFKIMSTFPKNPSDN
ncbi:MAG: YqgE/AlgH family protein [Crocinitomicaceae bacterium]|nr:YqgE/AlgH family protein [Crocinitomicaceae bacterium]